MLEPLNEHRGPAPFYPLLIESTAEGRIRFGGEAQLADVKNANGRIYREALWNMVVDDQRFRDRLAERKILGELDHPGDGRSKLTSAAMVVTDMRLMDSKRYPGKRAVYMQYETLSTPNGRILECLHNDKVGLAVSSRGDGEVRRVRDAEFGEAQEVIPETFKFETFDVVIDPSVDVDIRRIGESQTVAAAVHKILESEGSNLKESDISYYKELLENLQASAKVDGLKATASTIMKTPHASPILEDISMPSTENTAAELEAANRALQTKIDGYEAKIRAAESLTKQLVVDVQTHKMRAEMFEQKYNEVRREVEEANSLISSMLEGDEDGVADAPEFQELSVAHESLRREHSAAVSLVESLTSKVEAGARQQHITKITEDLTPKQLDGVLPFLEKCESIDEIDSTMEELRGLLSVNESRAPIAARLSEHNPIEKVTESVKKPGTTTTTSSDSRLTESLKLNEAMKKSRS